MAVRPWGFDSPLPHHTLTGTYSYRLHPVLPPQSLNLCQNCANFFVGGFHDKGLRGSLSPTLWAYMRCRLVRIALEVGEGRGIQPSDEYDERHYSAAAVYADIFVMEDGRFRKTCEKLEGAALV